MWTAQSASAWTAGWRRRARRRPTRRPPRVRRLALRPALDASLRDKRPCRSSRPSLRTRRWRPGSGRASCASPPTCRPTPSPAKGCASRTSPGSWTSSLHQRGEPGLKLAQTDVANLEGKLEVRADLLCLLRQPRIGNLAQVKQRLIVAEQHRFDIGMAVEPEAADDSPIEVAHE